MDKNKAKEILKEIIDTCEQYTDCKSCPFYNILKYPTDRCAFDDLSSASVIKEE